MSDCLVHSDAPPRPRDSPVIESETPTDFEMHAASDETNIINATPWQQDFDALHADLHKRVDGKANTS